MTMESEKDCEDLDIKKTFLVEIRPEDATLPIEVAATWTQGFLFINSMLDEIQKDMFVEEWIDEDGSERRKTHVHPLILPMMQERRHMLDQVMKIMGVDVINEAKREVTKSFAKEIFEMQMQNEKQLYKDKVKKIIEAEVSE